MAERATIHAKPRSVLGKKVARLRRAGILPANIYGHGLESTAVQVDTRDFLKSVRSAGVRSMFELRLEGEADPRYVLIRGLSRQGGTGTVIHADFYQVNLQVPITTNVNLAFTGEAPAVRDLAGTLLTMIESITVRCLPLDIPDSIEVDISVFTDFDRTLTVGDLSAPENVEIVTDPSVPIATVNAPRLRIQAGEEDGEEAAEAEEAPAEEAPSEEPAE